MYTEEFAIDNRCERHCLEHLEKCVVYPLRVLSCTYNVLETLSVWTVLTFDAKGEIVGEVLGFVVTSKHVDAFGLHQLQGEEPQKTLLYTY